MPWWYGALAELPPWWVGGGSVVGRFGGAYFFYIRGRFAGLRIAPLGYSPFAQLGGEGVGAACGSRLGCWGGGGIGGGWRADMISLGGWAVGSVRRRLGGWVGSAAAASAAA